MAKKRRRGPINKPNATPATEGKTTKSDFAKFKKYFVYIILIILAGTPFLVGKYIELNTPGPYDSGSYVYSAQHIADGAKLYVDESPSAQPMTLLVNFIGVKLFGFSETGPILIQGLLQLIAFAMMFLAIRKMYGPLAAVVSVVIASVYLSAPLVAKFGNVKEQFMISFMVITACCFILRQMDGKWWWALLTGAAAINIYYFKQTGASVIVAIMLYLLLSVAIAPKNWRSQATDFLLIIAGSFIGLLPLYTFYKWQDATPHLLRSLPAFTLISLLKLSVAGVVVYVLIRLARYIDLVTHLKKIRQVRRVIWISGAISISVIFIPCMVYYHSLVTVDLQFSPIADPGYMKYYNPDQVAAELKAIDTMGYTEYYKSLSERDIPLKKGGELDSYINSIAFIKYSKILIGYPVSIIKNTSARFTKIIAKATGTEGYVGSSRQSLDLKAQSKKVFSFYRALKLPVSLAVASILASIVVLILRVSGKKKQTTTADRLVFFMAVWWILDMTFVWISPRSYEQYYLPLIASASVLASYVCSFYSAKLNASKIKLSWLGAGALAVFVMLAMTSQIFGGLIKSPHTGKVYDKRDPSRKGYAQGLQRVKDSKAGKVAGWERAGTYINEHTSEDDAIYVWGWYPGIYVRAKRLSSTPRAFESEMHVRSPELLNTVITRLLKAFKKNPPKYIVDSRKSHFPWTGFPFELWPSTRGGFLPNQKMYIDKYDADVKNMILEKFPERFGDEFAKNEAARYEVMSAFRQFVMNNYDLVKKNVYIETPQGRKAIDAFAPHRVFKLKAGHPIQEPK